MRIKKLCAVILFCISTQTLAANIPTIAEVNQYRARVSLYISLHQSPDKIVKSMKDYFGKHFEAKYNPSDDTTDIFIILGEGNNIYFMQLVGTVKGQ